MQSSASKKEVLKFLWEHSLKAWDDGEFGIKHEDYPSALAEVLLSKFNIYKKGE